MLGEVWRDPRMLIVAVCVAFAVVIWMWRIVLGPSRRLTYRIVLDTPVATFVSPQRDEMAQRDDAPGWELTVNGRTVREPSLAVLSIENDGRSVILEDDWKVPLSFSFGGRSIAGVAVEAPKYSELKRMVESGLRWDTNRITLPALRLNRADGFSLIVALSESERNDHRPAQVSGWLGRGAVRLTRGFPAFKLVTASTVGMLVLTAAVLGSSATTNLNALLSPPEPAHCGAGWLTIDGSTSFSPMVEKISEAYRGSGCRHAQITVAPSGSFLAIRDMLSAPQEERAARIVMSDGAAPTLSAYLVGQPVAVVVYAIVVNKATGIGELTTEQLLRIYEGEYTNWNQVGGNDLKISIVSRGPESATRAVFERTVLGESESPPTSDDCIRQRRQSQDPYIRCEREASQDVLGTVNVMPGAIGYVDTRSVNQFATVSPSSNVRNIALNGREPAISGVVSGSYPFWTIETFYTYGVPAPDTLTSAFLAYLNSDAASVILRENDYFPCSNLGQSARDRLCRPA